MYNSHGINTFKIVFSALLPVAIFAGMTFLPQDYSALPIFFGALLSIFPYIFTMNILKQSFPVRARELILGDLWRVVGVSVLSCIVCEVALLIAYGQNSYRGIMTLILGLIYILLWACYSLMYFLRIKRANRTDK